MMTRRLLLGIAFCSTVLVSSVIYWLTWQFRPDYYVVQGEVNLYPIGNVDSLLWEGQYRAAPLEARELSELSTESNRLVKAAKDLREREFNLRNEITRLEAELKNLSRRLEDNRSKRIEQFRHQQLDVLQDDRDQLESKIVELEKGSPNEEGVYHPLRTVVAEMRLDLSRRDLNLATKRLEVAKKIVDDFGEFAEPADWQQFKAVYDQIGINQKEIGEIYSADAKLRLEAYDLVVKWRQQRSSRLSFADFIYFSIGVSTTTTFGDIIPNHSVTRSIVTGQLLVSIIIVGLFVNSLSPNLPLRSKLSTSKRRRKRRLQSYPHY
jgi:uncharacterized coiled-coil protein SlyX